MVSKLKGWIYIYFGILLILAPFIFPNGDSFYYWEWGNHLSLSYLDGPPMIAYMMRLATILFGNSFFALNWVGIACAAGVVYFLIKLGTLLRDQKTGFLAAALWLFFPLTAQNIFIRVTYDAPENLFWIMSLYLAARYAATQELPLIAGLGLAVGLLLLSKYTGVVLILGLLIYFLSQRVLRHVLMTAQFYVAVVIVLIVFAPVVIWNAEHDWVSIGFQLGQHVTQQAMPLRAHLLNMAGFLWRLFYCTNLLLILAAVFWILHRHSSAAVIVRRLLGTVSLVFIGFWLLVSYSGHAKIDYFLPLTLSLALLVADGLVQSAWDRFAQILLGIFAVISLIFVIDDTIWMASKLSFEYPVYLQEKQLILDAQKGGAASIITTGWNSVPQLEFLAKELGLPEVILPKHTCDLGLDGAYQYWPPAPLQYGQVEKAVYINVAFPYPACITPYFKVCTPLQTLVYSQPQLFTGRMLTVSTGWSICHT